VLRKVNSSATAEFGRLKRPNGHFLADMPTTEANVPVLNLPSVYIDDDVLWKIPALSFHVFSHVMQGKPEADIDRLQTLAIEHLAERDLLHTLAVMCSPDNPAFAAQFDEALGSEELHMATQILSEGKQFGISSRMDAETALSIIDRKPPRDLIEPLISKDWVAHLACGYILRRIISLHQKPETRKVASLTEAATRVERYCQANGIGGAGGQNMIRHVWPRYRSVAHLWGAWSIIQDCGLLEKAVPAWFPIFCGTAQWLLEQGAGITPIGRRPGETVLSLDEAWAMPTTRVPRSPDGSIMNLIWNDDPELHDICNRDRPPARQRV
jgi:hypothetical protein